MLRKLLLILMIFIAFSAYSSERAVFKSIKGKVEVKIGGNWTPAVKGMDIKPGTVISTGFKSTAVIDTGSSEIFVKQLTRMSLEELSKSGNTVKTNLNLRLGRVKANVKTSKGLKHNFTLKTPVSTAAVRGTVFESGIRTLDVESGSIRYSNKIGQQVTVLGGTSSQMGLTGFSAPSDMVDVINEAFKVATETGTGEIGDLKSIIDSAVESLDQTTLTIITNYSGI